MAMNGTVDEYDLACLAAFRPDTYAMSFPRAQARRLERMGLIKWVPPVLGTCWAITEKGQQVLVTLKQS